jgi:hypothetical protein
LKKLTIPLRLTIAHGHSGPLDRGLAGWPRAVAFGRPLPSSAWQNAPSARSPRGAWPAHAASSPELELRQGLHLDLSTWIPVLAATQNPSSGGLEWGSHRAVGVVAVDGVEGGNFD